MLLHVVFEPRLERGSVVTLRTRQVLGLVLHELVLAEHADTSE